MENYDICLFFVELSVESNARLFWFYIIRSVIGLQNLRYPLNQSDTKLKPIMTWSPTFSRVFDRLTFFLTYFEFSLANNDVNLGFWIFNAHLKTSLMCDVYFVEICCRFFFNRLIVYPRPPQPGGITVTTEDVACLAPGELLNDVIIDFYLK